MAGIDDIGGQVYPQGEDDNYDLGVFQVRNGEFYHFMLGKLASSLAALDEKKHGNAMCEIFGNYGWQEGLRLEKYLADHFMVRGVNHYVPHAFSAAQFPDPDCPPHFYAHGHNPEYKAFGPLMVYMNRANELISGGRHVAPVALLYHGEGEWTGKVLPDEKVARALAENQVEFDFVPFDAFSDKETYHTKIETGSLQINTQKYQAVLVPYMQFMDAAFVSDVKKLTDAGLPVYFVDGKPEGVFDGEISEQVLEENLADAEIIGLADIAEKTKEVVDITIAPQDSYIRYYHYIKEDGMQIYMLVNEGKEVYEGSLDLVQEKEKTISVYVYDAWEQKIYASDDKDGNCFILSEENNIVITQKDIRNVQLAKGAIQAGCEILLKKAGIGLNDINSIKIAGVFGKYIHVSQAMNFGLFPKYPEKLEIVGNAAGDGAAMALFEDGFIDEMEKQVKKVHHVELAGEKDFQKKFMNAMELKEWYYN